MPNVIPPRTVLRETIPERTTQFLTATIRDELDQGIPPHELQFLQLTIYALDPSKTIINARDHQSVLNVNGGTVSQGGAFTLELSPDDNAIIEDGKHEEYHVLLLEWGYQNTKVGRHEVQVKVVNFEKVP